MGYKVLKQGWRLIAILAIGFSSGCSGNEKIKGIDTLVINALRKESHISHFTLDEALHISYLVGPKHTYLTHVSHQMGRYVQEDPRLPENCHFAYDGLVIEA